MSCHTHITVADVLARERVAALRNGAGPRRRTRLARSARRRTGWLLVDVGLKLALGR